MKTISFFIAIAFSLAAYAQTDSLERVNLKKAQAQHTISKMDYNFISKKWDEFMQSNRYPEIALNDSQKVEYSYLMDFKGLSQEQLFERTLEWLAIRYGMIPSYLYSNASKGKIILTNFEKVSSSTKITFSCVITVKDNKIMVNFENVGYEYTSGGYYSGDTYVRENTDFTAINNVFPVITKRMDLWINYFMILRKMDSRFTGDIESLSEFISSYEQKYSF